MRSTVRLDILSTAFVYLSFTAYLSNAEIYIVSTTYRVEPIGLLEADFGPPVPELGTEGMLKVAAPEDACQPFTFQDFITPWFALISRQQEYPSSNCTFDVKVMNAQMAGAAAAIVYDNVFENLIIMSKPPGHPSPGIPSVFINQQAGLLLTKLLQVEGQLRVRITPMTGSEWITLLMSLVMVLMALLTFMASFYFVRLSVDWFNRGGAAAAAGVTGRTPGMVAAAAASCVIQDSGLPAHVLRSLPVIIYERSGSCVSTVAGAAVAVMPCLGGTGGEEESGQLPCSYDEEMGLITDEMGTGPSHINKGEPSSLPLMGSSSSSSEHEWPLPAGAHAGETKRTCAVCLEDYVEGEKVRVLPCLHRFHMQCVDQWLSTRRLCPVCKHDAGKPLAVVTSSLLLQHQGLGLEEGRANDGPATAFASARRRASAGLAMMRTGLISWFTAMAGDMPSVHPTVTQPLLDPPHSSPHRTRRAHRLGAAAAEGAGDEAGVGDAGTDSELAPEGPLEVQGGGLYFPPSPVGNESSTVISEGVGQPGQQHSLAVALQLTDQQQQQSNLGLLAGLSQPIQVPGPPTLFAEAGPPVIPPTPPPRLEPHILGGILWRRA
ncbi:hypothetical protein CEUSTIGMA_g10147.t1 [Chlamydomonas eustigma]|uniref:RING-type E3 ubiquitin transferase n=1 Tax=Chlamydomonas eustigma TaxID=1157962 RepID=A0A250XI15_9CHLO|nr:hypothetical protein CEUSTIGMA_g10147.t1 [Chlamydomonas eustigma]|eukprot:GAX82721.1 hypothetical protein CEUSTIGMA_g10147.t1 [Chlamydomonas eustigma]